MSAQDEADRALGAAIRRLLTYELAVNDGGLEIGRGRFSYYIEGTLHDVGGEGNTLDAAVARAAAKLPEIAADSPAALYRP